MSLTVGALMFLLLLFGLFAAGFEIAFAMALIGFLGFAWVVGVGPAFNVVATDIYTTFANYGFTVIPLFMLMGQIGANAGIARRLYDSSYKFIGHIPGGLAISTIVGAVLFKSVCGSTPATAATFAIVAIPEMDRYKYQRHFSCGTVATVGTLGVLLPPSVALIIYGIVANQSIARLFLAGIVPGLLIALSFVVVVYIWTKKNPEIGPKGARSTWGQRMRSISSAIPVAIIFLLVVGGLIMGYFTPTEAGSVGTLAVLIFSFAKKDINIKGFIASIADSLGLALMVLFLIAGASILGHFFSVTQLPFVAADWLMGLSLPPMAVIVIILLLYLLGGSFIEDVAFVILATPIFLPVVDKLGYNPLWFGILVMVILMIGIVLPPVAICVFIVSSITKTSQAEVYRGVYPYLAAMAVCTVILMAIPQLVLWLPNLLMK